MNQTRKEVIQGPAAVDPLKENRSREQTRRDFMSRAASLTALPLFSSLASGQASPERPNFVIVLCDDLGWGDLGCYGHPVIFTPHLDRFAREGARLTQCYAAAPVCSPARAGLLTGKTPNRTGIYDWIPAGSPVHLRPQENTISRLLQAAGYSTCHSGKWHLNGEFNSPLQPQPSTHGFDHWFSTQNNAAPSHRNPRNFVRNGDPVGPLEGYSSQLITDEAIRWLQSGRDPEQPFFLWTCFHSPHEPIATPPEFQQVYSAQEPGQRAEYYGNVTQIDHEFGRLVQALGDLNLSENTLVFFTSDNGPESLLRYPGAARSYGTPGALRGMNSIFTREESEYRDYCAGRDAPDLVKSCMSP